MAPKKVSVTVKFATPGTQPPIYLAGSFSDPAWEAQEMQYTTDASNEHQFYKEVEVEEGKEYQYKFRIGEGDWWILNEEAEIATDNIGNRNNLLAVPIHNPIENPTPPKSPRMASATDGVSEPPAVVNKAEPVVKKNEDTKTEGLAEAIKKAESEVKHAEDTEVKTKDSTSVLPAITEKVEPEVKDSGIIVPLKTEPEIMPHKEDIEVSTQDSTPAIDESDAKPKEDVKAIAKHPTSITHAFEPELENEENINAAVQHSAVLPAAISPDLKDAAEPKYTPDAQEKPVAPETTSLSLDEVKGAGSEKTPAVDKTPSPTLVVERIGSEPRYGDDFGADATVGQKDAHLLRAQDAEPDYVVVRSETSDIPEIASVAAEVADSAKFLDQELPTPPISDEEAGRIGFRRMSNTPIPEVANTAAEVADTAAALDKNVPIFKIDMPPPNLEDGPEAIDSGASTPWEERAPRFSHECPTLPTGQLQPASRHDYEGGGPRDPFAETVIDYNDPSIEEFPCEREAILEQVRSCQRRLSEDQVVVDGIPPSPVVGAHRYPERFDLPSPSPNLLPKHDDRSPSLDSIPEEHGYRDELLTELPSAMRHPQINAGFDGVGCGDDKDVRVTSVDIQEVAPESPPSGKVNTSKVEPVGQVEIDVSYITPPTVHTPSTPFVFDNSKQLGGENENIPRNVAMPDQGPSITVLPATPGSSLKNRDSDPFSKPINTAKATAIEQENGRGHLTSRKAPSPIPERPLTPTSMRGKDAKSKNFLKTFLNLVFVEWIGGLIMRLCGGGRNTLLVISLLVLITIASAMYFS